MENDHRDAPSNIEAEQDLLGAILTNNAAATRVSDWLSQEHFYIPLHGRIYASALGMIDKGEIANPVTMKMVFEGDTDLNSMGGTAYLAKLVGGATTVINALSYGKAVFECWRRRRVIEISTDAVNDALDPDCDPSEAVERAVGEMFSLSDGGVHQGGDMRTSVASTIAMIQQERDGSIATVRSGMATIDRAWGGLRGDKLYILAGRPGMGKSALCWGISRGAAASGISVGYFSLEMSKEDLMIRALAIATGINAERIESPSSLSLHEIAQIDDAGKHLELLPIYIDDTPNLSIEQIIGLARRLKKSMNIGLIVVDHIQRMADPRSMSRSDNRTRSLGRTIQGLKNLSKILGVPVLALSQLNRSVEEREDKRPTLGDLRESGEIEQEADVVTFLYREAYYLARQEPKDGSLYAEWQADLMASMNRADLIVAKRRGGKCGNYKLFFHPETTKFGDLA